MKETYEQVALACRYAGQVLCEVERAAKAWEDPEGRLPEDPVTSPTSPGSILPKNRRKRDKVESGCEGNFVRSCVRLYGGASKA